MAEETEYGTTLRNAIERTSSRRKLSFQLAEHTGNKQESEYRSLGKYLRGEDFPSPEKAALMAVLLVDPRVALVERPRRDRLAERLDKLEVRLAELEDRAGKVEETQRQGVDVVQGLIARLAALEAAPAREAQPPARQESEPRG